MTKIKLVAKNKKNGAYVDSITIDENDIDVMTAFYQDFNMCNIFKE